MSKAEKFIIDSTKNYSNEKRITVGKNSYWKKQPWLTPDEARKAVEIARDEIYEWLRVNLCNYFDATRSMFDMCLEDLKQAMQDE